MPKPSPNALLQRAIPFAILDRESLADAYNNKGPHADDARALCERFDGLKAKRFAYLDKTDLQLAMLAFIYAEQWESSLAESNPGADVEQRCRANVALFKELRHQVWGKTELEVSLESAELVDIKSGHVHRTTKIRRPPNGGTPTCQAGCIPSTSFNFRVKQ